MASGQAATAGGSLNKFKKDSGVGESRITASKRAQIKALLLKNAKVHMRTNACPCTSLCCKPVIFSACCMQLAFPVIFIFFFTAVPYALVSATSSASDRANTFDVRTLPIQMSKKWFMFVDTQNPSQSTFNPGNSATEGIWNSMFRTQQGTVPKVGARNILDTLFAPQSVLPGFLSQDGPYPFPFSCFCKTLAIVGGSGVPEFTNFLQAEYLQWLASGTVPLIQEWSKLSVFRRLEEETQAYANADDWKASPWLERLSRSDFWSLFQDAAEGLLDLTQAAESRGRRLQTQAIKDEWLRMALEWVQCNVNSQSPTDLTHKRTFFRQFSSKGDLTSFIQADNYGQYYPDRSETSPTDRLCGAVIFENNPLTSDQPQITIRMNVTATRRIGIRVDRDLTSRVTEGANNVWKKEFTWYSSSGFLAAQHMVQKWISSLRPPGSYDLLSGNPNFIPLPVNHQQQWIFGTIMGGIVTFPLTLTLQWAPIVASLAYYLARERQTKMREQMRMMGLSDSSLVWSWISMCIVINIFVAICTTILMQVFLFVNSDPTLLFVAVFLFANATLTFGMVIATLVSTDKMAALGAIILFFASSWASSGMPTYAPSGRKMIVSIFPPVGFLQTVATHFSLAQNLAKGSTWETLYVNYQNFSVGGGLFMLFIDFWIWLFVYYYLDQVVWWHDSGVPRKAWFLCLPSYWTELCGRAAASPEAGAAGKDSRAKQASADYIEAETEPRLVEMVQSNKCVYISNLCKQFTNARGVKFTAVDNLSLTMYDGECFCLLGHNGAGKTTTMQMLTGCLPQSSGSIKVRGYNIPEQVRQIRTSMGFCPQHNILWDELTVQEHINFFGTIGGLERWEIDERGDMLLFEVSLMDKKFARASALSGGMKRKLSAALAFLSKPYLVILDEPSSGMDPYARRGMWETLKRWRAGHIMCLTTHYMDEADAVGDRIGIMSKGALACCGSSTFLKRKFGCGYVLSFVKRANATGADNKIMEVIKQACGADAQVMSAIGKELLVQVPFSAAAQFPALFKRVDNGLEELGIESYGTSVTNLEEVFLKVAHAAEAATAAPAEAKGAAKKEVKAAATVETNRDMLKAGFFTQLLALLIRRVRFSIRNRTTLCCNLVLPPLCLIITCALLNLVIVLSLPQLALDTSKWNPTVRTSDKVPITVGSSQGSAATAAAAAAWTSNYVGGVTSVDAQMGYTPRNALNASCTTCTGMAEEFAFMEFAFENAQNREASQYGAISFSEHASWTTNASAYPVTPGVNIWSNLSALHAPSVMFNLHASAAVRARDPAFKGFVINNLPFENTKYEASVLTFLSGIFAGIMVIAAFAFLPAGMTSYVVMEKEREVKHQLVISGCSIPAYWLSNLVFDVLLGIFPVIAAMLVLKGFKVTALTDGPGRAGSVLMLLAYLPAAAGMSYLMSFAFSKAGISLMVAWLLSLVTGFFWSDPHSNPDQHTILLQCGQSDPVDSSADPNLCPWRRLPARVNIRPESFRQQRGHIFRADHRWVQVLES